MRARSIGSLSLMATLLGSACSLLNPLDGFTTPTVGETSVVDAATIADVATFDAPVDVKPSNAPRVWRSVAVAGPSGRHSGKMVFDPSRKKMVLVAGTRGGSSSYNNDAWEWDGTAWSPSAATSMPQGQKGFGLVYDTPSQSIFLAGRGAFALTGNSWASRGTTPPQTQYGTTMVYDPARSTGILFGGSDGNISFNQTWEWTTAAGFVQKSPSTSPPSRRAAAMAYDEARQRVVLFGGAGGGSPASDTWEYDGVTWTERIVSVSPSPRHAACAAYDARRKRVVLFGGRTDKNVSLSDFWEWDGQAWSLGPSGPPGRRSCAMAYDPVRDVIVMFGGTLARSGTTYDNAADTWLYE